MLSICLANAEDIKKQAAEGAVVGGVDFTGATALHLAAVFGHADAAEVLLQAGALPNLADRQALPLVPPQHNAWLCVGSWWHAPTIAHLKLMWV